MNYEYTDMTQIIQKLLGQLQRLPESLQEQYASRWIHELTEEQGDGATQETTLQEGSQVNYDDIEHLLGRFEGKTADLSSNPKYMEGFGKKSMGSE